MALGKSDTRALFRKSIKPILLSAGIEPRCMTFIDHNDELNYRIIREIKSAHIILADLTYARPSVYYEAGFAERANPVIYSCRKDHFPRNGKTLDENMMIHFDLQMKNVIGWSHPDDRSFQRALKSRINLVKEPILRSNATTDHETREARVFEAKSVHARLEALAEQLSLSVSKFRLDKVPTRQGISWMGKRYAQRSVKCLASRIDDRLTIAMIRDLRYWYGGVMEEVVSAYPKKVDSRSKMNVQDVMLLCTLNKLPITRVRQVLPHAEKGVIENELIIRRQEQVSIGRKDVVVNRVSRIFILDDIRSVGSFQERLRKLNLSSYLE
jgi:hypothetical protein